MQRLRRRGVHIFSSGIVDVVRRSSRFCVVSNSHLHRQLLLSGPVMVDNRHHSELVLRQERETSERDSPAWTKHFDMRALGKAVQHAQLASTRGHGIRYRPSLRRLCQTIVGNARYRASKRGWECSLSVDVLSDMLWMQRGKCYYSGVPMNYWQPFSHWRLTCERLDSCRGCTDSNCVLVAAEFNTSDCSMSPRVRSQVFGTAQWSKLKVQRVPDLRQRSVDLKKLSRLIQEARSCDRKRVERVPSRSTSREVICVGHANSFEKNCSSCKLWKPLASFYSKIRSRDRLDSMCKECARERGRIHLGTLRGSIVNVLSNAASRAKGRGQICDITRDGILDKLWEQQGRCYYSGVPLDFRPHSDWRMSLERICNDEGCTLDNCVWVAHEFNTPDYSRNRAKCTVQGTAQWSKAKVDFVWSGSKCNNVILLNDVGR